MWSVGQGKRKYYHITPLLTKPSASHSAKSSFEFKQSVCVEHLRRYGCPVLLHIYDKQSTSMYGFANKIFPIGRIFTQAYCSWTDRQCVFFKAVPFARSAGSCNSAFRSWNCVSVFHLKPANLVLDIGMFCWEAALTIRQYQVKWLQAFQIQKWVLAEIFSHQEYELGDWVDTYSHFRLVFGRVLTAFQGSKSS